jgi:hypothetical protein
MPQVERRKACASIARRAPRLQSAEMPGFARPAGCACRRSAPLGWSGEIAANLGREKRRENAGARPKILADVFGCHCEPKASDPERLRE